MSSSSSQLSTYVAIQSWHAVLPENQTVIVPAATLTTNTDIEPGMPFVVDNPKNKYHGEIGKIQFFDVMKKPIVVFENIEWSGPPDELGQVAQIPQHGYEMYSSSGIGGVCFKKVLFGVALGLILISAAWLIYTNKDKICFRKKIAAIESNVVGVKILQKL
jgi:hypothetical protein